MLAHKIFSKPPYKEVHSRVVRCTLALLLARRTRSGVSLHLLRVLTEIKQVTGYSRYAISSMQHYLLPSNITDFIEILSVLVDRDEVRGSLHFR